jgi:hypothetical protein
MKKLFLYTILACLVIFPPEENAQNLKTAIAKIGCTQIKVSDIKPMSLTDEELRQWLESLKFKSKTSFIAKCGGYRYLFEEEVFANEDDAKLRLPEISKLPPKENDKSDFSVPILLREGFVLKNKIYTVGAFTYFLDLEGYVKKYKDKLAKNIK